MKQLITPVLAVALGLASTVAFADEMATTDQADMQTQDMQTQDNTDMQPAPVVEEGQTPENTSPDQANQDNTAPAGY